MINSIIFFLIFFYFDTGVCRRSTAFLFYGTEWNVVSFYGKKKTRLHHSFQFISRSPANVPSTGLPSVLNRICFFCFIKEKSRYIFLPNFLLQSQSFFFSKKAPRKSRQRQPPAVYKKTSESLTAPSVAVESPAGPVQWPKPLQRFSFVLRFAFFVSFRRALLPPNNNNNNNNNHPAMVVEIE